MSNKNLTNSQVLLKEIVRQEYDQSGQFACLDEFFEFFAANQILKDYAFSNEDVENGLVGGANDGGCDAAYVLLNDKIVTPDQIDSLACSKGSSLQLIVIQAKNTNRFSEDVILKWKTLSENLLEISNDMRKFSGRYSEEVREVFLLFRNVVTKLVTRQLKVSFKYYYATLGIEIHPNLMSQADELMDVVHDKYPSASVSVDFITAEKLMLLYNSEPDLNVVIDLAEQAITLGKGNECIALVNISNYYKFITDGSGGLLKGMFESNVRDYQGGNSVNTHIANSLKNKTAEDFWWLNNGITVLSDGISLITSKKLSIDNPEIVNGLQTSHEIYNYFSEHPERLEDEKRNILVRFIVPDSEEIRDHIIFATNNQTNIPKSSLRVTDGIHLQIEMFCKTKGLYYDRRKNYYKNLKIKSADIMSVSFLAQCLITILLRKPDFARARPSTLLTEDRTYNQLYSESFDLMLYYNVGRLGKTIQKNLRQTANWTFSEKNDMLFYVLYGLVSRMLGKKNICVDDIVNFDISSISEEEINLVKDKIYGKYKELGGNGTVAKDPKFINCVDEVMGL